MPKKEVLVVDDEEDMVNITKILLEHEGYQVTGAGNGEEALEIISKGFSPSIILLDLLMPKMGGEELARKLMADPKTQNIPRVIVTADIRVYKISGVNDISPYGIILKPFDIDELAEIVDRVTSQQK